MIPNHAAASLSELDLRIARAVPPGGNWRDVPEDVPSARLAQIRVSAAAGEGSRSTYYGRLRSDRPSYTVGTYYNRPGNGCFLHHDAEGGQHRTLSHREAARLQSFPDSFKFSGPQRAVCQQIGNAVPPLLAFQVARALGDTGDMVDVFAGAGGLSLGFEWAGWRSVAATDSDAHAVATFNANVAPVATVGDMRDQAVHDRLASAAGEAHGGRRLALVGGPPCQGFSTGGKRRSPEDERNSLYLSYVALLERLRPDLLVFENVLGLLSMEGGKFLDRIIAAFRRTGYETALWRLNAADFGVPQRRERVIIVGVPIGVDPPFAPRPWTSPVPDLSGMPAAPTVAEALGDLPRLVAGQDGSGLPYAGEPGSSFSRLMRGRIGPTAYLQEARLDTAERPRSVRGVAAAAA